MIVVRKRDKTLEPFSLAKLRNSISRALEVAGTDEDLSAPLAQAIHTYLRSSPVEDRRISSDQLFKCARVALVSAVARLGTSARAGV